VALLVGLTGGMGSGKTTVSKIFRELGAHVLDADEICRSLVKPGQPAWQEIVNLLGPGILREDQSLDRRKTADLVFNDPEKKQDLEAILHPRVMDEERALYNEILKTEPNALVIIDAALLIESGNYRKVDKVIVIACDEEVQVQRVTAQRGFAREDALRRMRLQMTLAEKIKFADFVIHNDAGLPELREKIETLFHQLKSMAG